MTDYSEPNPDTTGGHVRTEILIRRNSVEGGLREYWAVRVWQLPTAGISSQYYVVSELVGREHDQIPNYHVQPLVGVHTTPRSYPTLAIARTRACELADVIGGYYLPGSTWVRDDF